MNEIKQKYKFSEKGREKQREYRFFGNTSQKSENKIDSFKQSVRNGPFYICIVCNRCLYKRSVKSFDEIHYNISNEVFLSRTNSFNGNEYICLTCHSKLIKGRVPCQAVSNNLQLFELPNAFSDLRKLERVLISKRLLFKRITIMPKGQSSKIKGGICNVPIEADEICNILPRSAENNGIVQVSLKKKNQFQVKCIFRIGKDKRYS